MKPLSLLRMRAHFNKCLLLTLGEVEVHGGYSFPVGGIPDDPMNGVEDGCLFLTPKDMKGVFDPTIDKIISMTQEEIKIVEKNTLPVTVCNILHLLSVIPTF